MAGGLFSTVQFDLLYANLSDENQDAVDLLCKGILGHESALEPVEVSDLIRGKSFYAVRCDNVVVSYERRGAYRILLTCLRRDS